ncbi:MAG: acetate/propionate family kinase, partial [Christensenellales bacterium]
VEPMPNHTVALECVLRELTDKDHGVISDVSEINAVGHRVLHSGEDFDGTVLIDDEVIKICEKNEPLGPLHMPANIACIKSCKQILPEVPMAAVFDTAFHSTMPKKAFLYGIPYEMYEDWKIRRYGFHGTSHKYVSGEAIKYLGNPDAKIVTCHLGNGSSIAAVKAGKCIDTSMGFTPLEGLVMGTRSGDIDPAVIEFIMDKTGMNIHEMLTFLNKKCGILGLSTTGADFRDLTDAKNRGEERAILAFDVFAYRVKKYIGAYAAAMGGLDCVVFTGGVGENDEYVRELTMKDMEWLGIDFDVEKSNKVGRGPSHIIDLSGKGKTKVLIVPTNEELVIARETMELI